MWSSSSPLKCTERKILSAIGWLNLSVMKKNHFYLLITSICFTLIFLGLFSRKAGHLLPHFIAQYAGDTLWAMLIYFLTRGIFRVKTSQFIFILSVSFCFLIEFSQLYQADWINNVRSTTLGSLILGHGFLCSDLICYLVGIFISISIDKISISTHS